MRGLTFLVSLLLVAGGLGLGCERKPSSTGPADGAAAVEPAVRHRTLDAGLPTGFMDPIQAKDQIRDPVAYASKMNEMARQVDPKDAPEYAKKMVEHMRQIATLMSDHLDDCDQVVVVVRTYIDQHREQLKALHEEGSRVDAGLSPEERSKLQAQILLLMAPFAEGLARAQSRFAVQCMEQARAVAGLMKAVIGD